MLTVIGDTHRREGHGLEGDVLAAVHEADHVLHVGDFLTTGVYDAIDAEADHLTAVYGNNDERTLRDRLPRVATLEWEGLRIVATHGHEHTDTALAMLARQEGANLVVVGHSHRPRIDAVGETPRLNPGSYASPRQFEPAYGEIRANRGGFRIRLCEPEGDVLREVDH